MLLRRNYISFSFTPDFFKFFSKFNYLPPSIRSKKVIFRKSLVLIYFFSSLIKLGNKFKILNLFNEFQSMSWFLQEQEEEQEDFTSYKSFQTLQLLNFMPYITNFFQEFNFIFFFFFSKLNKKLLKFSNYKKPRFSIHLLYIPPYRRLKTFLKFNIKSIFYYDGKTFRKRLRNFLRTIFFETNELPPVKYSLYIQNFVLKKKKNIMMLR